MLYFYYTVYGVYYTPVSYFQHIYNGSSIGRVLVSLVPAPTVLYRNNKY